MAEYVEKSPLLKRMEGYCSATCGHEHGEDPLCQSCFMNDAIILVEDQTAADVVERKRATWDDDWEMCCSTCSACDDSFLWEDFKGVAVWNFCPNCGADMRRAE